jgi:catalase
MLRDGLHQHAVHTGVAPYRPNSLDGGCPFAVGPDGPALEDLAVALPASTKVRASPASYDDHFSQARLFWRSMSPVEQEHIIRAYAFELGKCYEQTIKERQLQCLANIDPVLCSEVAAGLGLPAPEPTVVLLDEPISPALSQLGESWPLDGRMIGIVVDPQGDLTGVEEVRTAILAEGMTPLVIAPHGGEVAPGLTAQRTFATARSVEFDAVLVAGCPAPAPDALPVRDAKAGAADSASLDPRVVLLLEECFRHAKAIGAWGDGEVALDLTGCGTGPGVVRGDGAAEVLARVRDAMTQHRAWERFLALV